MRLGNWNGLLFHTLILMAWEENTYSLPSEYDGNSQKISTLDLLVCLCLLRPINDQQRGSLYIAVNVACLTLRNSVQANGGYTMSEVGEL